MLFSYPNILFKKTHHVTTSHNHQGHDSPLLSVVAGTLKSGVRVLLSVVTMETTGGGSPLHRPDLSPRSKVVTVFAFRCPGPCRRLAGACGVALPLDLPMLAGMSPLGRSG